MPLSSVFAQAARECIERYPLLHDAEASPLAYGTAGFRTSGEFLPPVAARIAFVAILRSFWAAQNTTGCSVGCVVTASHNPAADNGLKIIDVDGGMLAASWESFCTAAANSTTCEKLLDTLEEYVATFNISTTISGSELSARCPFAVVHLARDTRPSGSAILLAIQLVLRVLCVSFTDHGILTTPQLHYLVQRANQQQLEKADMRSLSEFGSLLYAKELLSSLAVLLNAVVGKRKKHIKRRQKVVIDTANGVGALTLRSLFNFAEVSLPNHPLLEFFDIILINDDVGSDTLLNHMCGADFAQKTRLPSDKMKKWAAAYEQKRKRKTEKDAELEEVHYYSLDGDADRVVAFFNDTRGGDKWSLLDGDRVAILYALALRHWLGQSVFELLDVGVVQTAYANGASSDYLQRHLGLHVYSAATGVKNLHPVAQQRDIGIYFEANGHGTVLFNEKNIASKLTFPPDSQASVVLSTLPKIFSQSCGDGIADAFMCEVALLAMQMNFCSWCDLYRDLPSLQCKLAVPNPKVITNTPDERRALTPQGLQEAIDAAVAAAKTKAHSLARAFVRPSGTEPIVRLYAEADDVEACKKLAEEVEEFVRHYC